MPFERRISVPVALLVLNVVWGVDQMSVHHVDLHCFLGTRERTLGVRAFVRAIWTGP